MDSLSRVHHDKFSYIFIPADINDKVNVLFFEGQEKEFKDELTYHFCGENLFKQEKCKFKEDLKEKSNGKLSSEQLDTLIETSQTYQIIPLTLPSSSNKFEGINAYIDSIGRIKNLGVNSRASHLCSTDIRGDCFLSKTFDDDDQFKRINITMYEYREMMNNPPSSSGRWNESVKMSELLVENPSGGKSCKETNINGNNTGKSCANCGKKENIRTNSENVGMGEITLKRCGACSSVFYCSSECQKSDWKYHKRTCKPVSERLQ